jgi:hypothetical protein
MERAVNSEFDLNKIAVDLAHRVFTDTVKSVSSNVRDAVKRLIDVFRKDLSAYLTSTITRCSQIKTPIINRDSPTYLPDIYVHTKLSLKNKTYEDDEFIAQLPALQSIVVAGSAGSGKSMFMRYLFLSLCERGYGRIPIFVELRNLNNFAVKELSAYIYYSIVGTGGVLTQDQFDAGLKNGAFSVILDGFDEIDVDQRKLIESQILQFREKYNDILLIVSSRPDPENRFGSWSRFHVANVRPMDQTQVVELIKRIDYDSKIKREFVKGVKDGRFNSHESFISNPLLCIMMLVTFSQTGHIPDKRHIFYEQAFDALFFLHDSAKEGVYRRKTYAQLPIDEFRNCLSSFCIVSYAKEKFSFSHGELRDFITQAFKIEKKEVKQQDFMNDLIESTCLLQMEGTEYIFTHRSFQEYFSAFFIARSPASNLPRLLDQFSRRREDDVVAMAFAMNRHLLEREWILPRLHEFIVAASGLDVEKDTIGYITSLFGPFTLRVMAGKAGEFYYQEPLPNASVWLAISDLYKERFIPLFRWVEKQRRNEVHRVQQAYEELKGKGDRRIVIAEGRISARQRKRQSYSIVLTSADNKWVSQTRIKDYFKRQRNVIEGLIVSIEEDVKRQNDVLESLL